MLGQLPLDTALATQSVIALNPSQEAANPMIRRSALLAAMKSLGTTALIPDLGCWTAHHSELPDCAFQVVQGLKPQK